MHWLLLSIIAYFIYALVFVGDRILVTRVIKAPLTYAFYTGILHGVAILLIPLLILASQTSIFADKVTLSRFIPGSGLDLIVDLLAGACFFIAMYFLYRALFHFDTSQIIPLVGSLIPLLSLFLASLIFSEYLAFYEIWAFVLLLIGGILISVKDKLIASYNCFLAGFWSAFFFGLFYALTDYIYQQQYFWSGFVWARMGTALTALLILAFPYLRNRVWQSTQKITAKTQAGAMVVIIHALGASAFLMIHYAISLSHVSLVNALQGIQYVFLIALVYVLSKKYPRLLTEKFTKANVLQKIVAISAISLGLIILAVYA